MLDPIVQPWIEAKQNSVLKEDRDLRHRVGKPIIVSIEKQEYSFEIYFNCHKSSNPADIENCLQSIKRHLCKNLN